MNSNKQKLIARIMAIFLSVLMLGSGLTLIITMIIDLLSHWFYPIWPHKRRAHVPSFGVCAYARNCLTEHNIELCGVVQIAVYRGTGERQRGTSWKKFLSGLSSRTFKKVLLNIIFWKFWGFLRDFFKSPLSGCRAEPCRSPDKLQFSYQMNSYTPIQRGNGQTAKPACPSRFNDKKHRRGLSKPRRCFGRLS